VGLIGGSFALSLRAAGKVKHIVGVGRGSVNLAQALKLRVIDEAAHVPAAAVKGADMVFLATHAGQVPGIMARIAPALERSCIVTDAGSTKQDVERHAREHLASHLECFVPAHPVAGAEKSGVEAARADLFQNKNVVVTPLPETSSTALQQVEVLWQACGARLHTLTPARHDEIFSAVSHLPHVLAYAMVDQIAGHPEADLLFKFAASGFRDFTRIASSSPEMWKDICLANRAALLQELHAYQALLAKIARFLEHANAAEIEALFQRAQAARSRWIESNQ
jgi:prephenate dehydrogenase